MTTYGENFEREAILVYAREEDRYECTVTRMSLFPHDLISNHKLKLEIQKWTAESSATSTGDNDDKNSKELGVEEIVVMQEGIYGKHNKLSCSHPGENEANGDAVGSDSSWGVFSCSGVLDPSDPSSYLSL